MPSHIPSRRSGRNPVHRRRGRHRQEGMCESRAAAQPSLIDAPHHRCGCRGGQNRCIRKRSAPVFLLQAFIRKTPSRVMVTIHSRFDITDKFAADRGDGTAFRCHDPDISLFAEAERTQTKWVTNTDQLARAGDNQGISATCFAAVRLIASSAVGAARRSLAMWNAITSESIVVWKIAPVSSSWRRISNAFTRFPLCARQSVPLKYLSTSGCVFSMVEEPVVGSGHDQLPDCRRGVLTSPHEIPH